MQGARGRWAVGLAVLIVVASGCGAAGGSPQRASTEHVSASRPDPRAVDPESAVATSPVPVPAPVPAPSPTTVTTRAVASAPVPAPVPSVPTVTIVAFANGAITGSDDHPCSNTSSRSVTRGQFEVRRSGPTTAELTVTYGDSGIAKDYLPLAGQITIPAGAASAVVTVDPTMIDPPAPAHVHRSSSLAVTLNDGATYDVGPESSAAIGLTFDVDHYGCPKVAA